MDWDHRMLGLARHVADWSKDPSTKVGAVISRPDRTIVSIGFNGFPRRVEDKPHRLLDRDMKLALTVHAELNAILTARQIVEGFTIYTWPLMPCSHCAGAIIQSGLKRVVSPADIPDRWLESMSFSAEIFREAGVVLERLTGIP